MSDTIYRQAAIDVLEERLKANGYSNTALVSELNRSIGYLRRLPAAQPEPLTLRVNRELTKEEYDKLMRDIKNAPIILLPYEQPDRKTGEWLHDLLQDAIDDGIITETQASRLMDMINDSEDNT